MATTTDFTTSVEKSIRYDRDSGDYCCTLTIDGEPISLGYASTYSQGEAWCNAEYYRILQDGVALAPKEIPAPEPDAECEFCGKTAGDACEDCNPAPLPFDATPDDVMDMPIPPVDGLPDNQAVIYDTHAGIMTGIDRRNGEMLLCREDAIDATILQPDEAMALYLFFQRPVIQEVMIHIQRQQLLAGGDPRMRAVLDFIDAHFAAEASKQAVPAPATPSITIEQHVWPDIDDEVYTSTVYRYGQAEVLVHHDGVPGNLTAYDLVVNQHNMDARDVQGIFDAAILLADARVQAALEVIGLPVEAAPAAPAVIVARWTEPESGNETGTDYTLGLAELHIPDNGTPPLVWLQASDDRTCCYTDLAPCFWDALPDAAALLASATVRHARGRVESSLTALPQSQMRKAA